MKCSGWIAEPSVISNYVFRNTENSTIVDLHQKVLVELHLEDLKSSDCRESLSASFFRTVFPKTDNCYC